MAVSPGWARDIAARLKADETVSVKVHGNSMRGLIADGSRVTIVPILPHTELTVGQVVLVEIAEGEHRLHRIAKIDGTPANRRYLIAQTSRQEIDGWFKREKLVGVVTEIAPPNE